MTPGARGQSYRTTEHQRTEARGRSVRELKTET